MNVETIAVAVVMYLLGAWAVVVYCVRRGVAETARGALIPAIAWPFAVAWFLADLLGLAAVAVKDRIVDYLWPSQHDVNTDWAEEQVREEKREKRREAKDLADQADLSFDTEDDDE